MKIEFKEEQRFTQWWLWILLIGIGILPIIGIYKQLFLKEDFGNNPMSDIGMIVFTLFVYALILFFYFINLRTEIDKNEIRIHFFPFFKKRVFWKDIKKAEIVNYGFVGYGIRYGSKYGVVYNTKGKKGLAIELNNGKKFVLGTQKEKELIDIVKSNLSRA